VTSSDSLGASPAGTGPLTLRAEPFGLGAAHSVPGAALRHEGFLIDWPAPGGGYERLFSRTRGSADAIGASAFAIYSLAP
jgi:hypothetical protein